MSAPQSFRSIAIILATLLLLPIAGCGDDKKTEVSEKSTVDLTELREAAESARDAAKAVGADQFASESFEKGLAQLEKAENYAEESPSKAKGRFRSAKTKFEDAIEETEKNKKRAEGFAASLKEFETKRDALKEAGADKLAAEAFTRAVKDYEAAKSLSAEGNSTKAKQKLRYALRDLSTAEQQVNQLASSRKLAEEERALMQAELATATTEMAENLAPDDWRYASDSARDAQNAFDAGEFEKATRLYRQAKNSYAGAARFARDKKALASRENNSSSRGNDGGGIVRNPDRGSAGEAPGLDEIERPSIDDDTADLSDLPSLFQGIGAFKENGAFELSWTSGVEMQKDVTVLAGKVGGRKANLIWEGDEGVGDGKDGNYIFAGNTKGHMLVDCGFEDAVSVRALIQFQLLTQKPFMEIVLMSEEGKQFYATEFGSNIFAVEDNARLKKPKAKAAQPTYRQPFNKWISKREPYEITFTYHKAKESEKGILTTKLNGEVTAQFETDQFRRGKVGFRWFNTKFYVEELEIQGFIDENWAMEALKANAASEGGSDGGFGF